MKRGKTDSIANILNQVLQKSPLERGLSELHAVNVAHELLGNLATHYVRKMELRSGILYIHVTSSALRQELHLSRHAFIEKINTKLGKQVVTDLRLL